MAAPFYTFNQPETLEEHIEDFEFHCDSKGNVAEEQKRGMFMESLDKPTKRSLRDWLAPTLTPRSATYARIVATLREKIQPSVNKFVAWTNFQRRKQQAGESATAFHADLKRLAAPCGFEVLESKLVLYQFVNGLQNRPIQQSLLAKHAGLTLSEALRTVSASEESVESSKAVRGLEVEEVHPAENRRPRGGKREPTSRLICYRCGDEDSHTARKCLKPWRTFKCTKCGKSQHLAKACRQRTASDRPASHGPSPPDPRRYAHHTNYLSDCDDTEEDDPEGVFIVHPRDHPPESDEVIMRPVVVTVVINGIPLKFEVDSGASRTIISHPTFTGIFAGHPPPIYDSDVDLVTWGDDCTLSTTGRFFADIHFKGRIKHLPVVVGKGSGPNLLGRNWFIPFGLSVEGVFSLTEPTPTPPSHTPTLSELLKLPAVTGECTGCYRGPPLYLQLDPSVKPVYCPTRRVPFALTTRMNDAIDANVQKGHWVPMRHAGEWASPIVPVPKPNGKLRLCADYSFTVNPALLRDSYRTSTADEVFARLSGGRTFAAIDLEEAYQQCPVDDMTSRVLAVNTVKGLFRVVRMPYGISLAPSAFHRVLDSLVGGLPGTVAYQDNIYVTAENANQLRQRVYHLLQILGEAGVKVNTKKCVWEADCIEVVGFRLDASGRRPIPERVDAIKKAPAPTCKRELQSLLGLVNFYDCFFKHKATTFEPLYRLLDAGTPWKWTSVHEKAFPTVKDQISRDEVLAHFSSDAELILTCDASQVGVGAILATVVTTGARTKREAPICFASRTLDKTECRYSQLDKEALAIKFGVTKFEQYLSGRPFTIVTDHRPLLGIFRPGKPIPTNLSPRLLCYALLLASMRYTLVYRPGTAIGQLADYLSRHPVEASQEPQDPDPAGVHLLEARQLPGLSASNIARETAADPSLRRVLQWTVNGWPLSVPDEFSVYFRKRDELSVLKDCLLYRHRVVVPPSLQDNVLQLVHATHLGESYSKSTARAIVWWPGIDSDVVNTVKTCDPCQKSAKSPRRKIVSPWPRAESPWERVHMDYFALEGHNFLLAVDSYSRWTVVRLVTNLSTSVLITHTRYMLADYGKPVVIVTDNGAQFASQEFNSFLHANGVQHLFSPPWHPASNGLAERTVGTFKNFFKRFQSGDIHARVARTLWALRTAPSSSGERTPAEIMGRPFRTHLSQLHPDRQPMKTPSSSPAARRPGEMVWVLQHRLHGTEWIPGVVAATNSARCVDVRLVSGKVMNNVSGDHVRLRFGEESQTTLETNFNQNEYLQSQPANPPRTFSPKILPQDIPTSGRPTAPPSPSSLAMSQRSDGTPPPDPRNNNVAASAVNSHARSPPEHPPSDPPIVQSMSAETPTTSSKVDQEQVTNTVEKSGNSSGDVQVDPVNVDSTSIETRTPVTQNGQPPEYATNQDIRSQTLETNPVSTETSAESNLASTNTSPVVPFYGFPIGDTAPSDSRSRRSPRSPQVRHSTPSERECKSPQNRSGRSSAPMLTSDKSTSNNSRKSSSLPHFRDSGLRLERKKLVPDAHSNRTSRGRGSSRSQTSCSSGTSRRQSPTCPTRLAGGRGRGEISTESQVVITRPGLKLHTPQRFEP